MITLIVILFVLFCTGTLGYQYRRLSHARHPGGWRVECRPDPEGMEVWLVKHKPGRKQKVMREDCARRVKRDRSAVPSSEETYEERLSLVLAEERTNAVTMNASERKELTR